MAPTEHIFFVPRKPDEMRKMPVVKSHIIITHVVHILEEFVNPLYPVHEPGTVEFAV